MGKIWYIKCDKIKPEKMKKDNDNDNEYKRGWCDDDDDNNEKDNKVEININKDDIYPMNSSLYALFGADTIIVFVRLNSMGMRYVKSGFLCSHSFSLHFSFQWWCWWKERNLVSCLCLCVTFKNYRYHYHHFYFFIMFGYELNGRKQRN